MTYTATPPTVPGWYWVRCHKKTGPEPSYTDWHAIKFTEQAHGLDAANGVLSIKSCAHFAGPIPEPTEPEHQPPANAEASQCSKERRAAGLPYPRTCPTCGLFGPCKKGLT